jgi:hypothetical protein
MFAQCIFVVDAEMGTGLCAGDVQIIIQRRFRDVVCMKDSPDSTKPGAAAKKEMTHLDASDIRIYKQFITSDTNPVSIIAQFETQMLQYERIVEVSKSPHKQSSVFYSGKASGRDDVFACTIQVHV